LKHRICTQAFVVVTTPGYCRLFRRRLNSSQKPNDVARTRIEQRIHATPQMHIHPIPHSSLGPFARGPLALRCIGLFFAAFPHRHIQLSRLGPLSPSCSARIALPPYSASTCSEHPMKASRTRIPSPTALGSVSSYICVLLPGESASVCVRLHLMGQAATWCFSRSCNPSKPGTRAIEPPRPPQSPLGVHRAQDPPDEYSLRSLEGLASSPRQTRGFGPSNASLSHNGAPVHLKRPNSSTAIDGRR
jgi:hypothetical protein